MSSTGPWALSLDTIFELLSRKRRRYALYVLYRDGEDGIALDELAGRVSELEGQNEDDTPKGHDEIVATLRERQLPTLVAARVIDFDERSGMIRYRGQPSLEEWIEHAEFKEGKQPDG